MFFAIEYCANACGSKDGKCENNFFFIPKTTIYLGHSSFALKSYADYVNNYILAKYGFKLKITQDWKLRDAGNCIELTFTPFVVTPKDAYTLTVTKTIYL